LTTTYLPNIKKPPIVISNTSHGLFRMLVKEIALNKVSAIYYLHNLI